MIFEKLNVPVVLAPLAGGPSTPELAAAVSEARGLGFLGGGYLAAADLHERISATRERTVRPFGVNLFTPGAGPAEPGAYGPYLERLARWAERTGIELGEPTYNDDDWEEKLDLLASDPVEVVSFTFGCPPPAVVASLRSAGSEVWVTVTTPDEAHIAAAAGADALVVQGAEAGGHRGSFSDDPDGPVYGLLPLLELVGGSTELPLVASGGIATGPALAAVLSAGARAAQIGTAFMLAPEAGTSPAHRAALRSAESTVLTRAFTGRLARGIRNGFISQHDAHAPVAYPELHYVTAPMRKRARLDGDADLINLWAGEAHALALELPAAEIVVRLASDAEAALAAASVAKPAVERQALRDLARGWYEAWNAHELDRILSHYAEGVVFSSPFVAELGASASGTIVGKGPLRDYWTLALERFPDLRFEPISELYGVGSVTLHYRGVGGVAAAEMLELDSAGLVFRAAAHYERIPNG